MNLSAGNPALVDPIQRSERGGCLPRKAVSSVRRLKTTVPREVNELLAFVNADRGISGKEVAIRGEFAGWLRCLVKGNPLPRALFHPPYQLDFDKVGKDYRSSLDWFSYRKALEWLAKQGCTILRECPTCEAFFLLKVRGRRTRTYCDRCAR